MAIDLRRRAVVALERDRLGARDAVRELGDQRGVGPVPRVDRLVRVADDAQVEPIAPPRLEQPELQRVHVLELVDEQMAELPALRARELGIGLDAVRAQPQQIVEVDEALVALLLLVAVVQVGHRVRIHRRVSSSGRGFAG